MMGIFFARKSPHVRGALLQETFAFLELVEQKLERLQYLKRRARKFGPHVCFLWVVVAVIAYATIILVFGVKDRLAPISPLFCLAKIPSAVSNEEVTLANERFGG
jgi:hypothetical protein